MAKTTEIIYFRESLVQSVISDAFMFGSIFALLYFNHQVLSGNAFIDFVFIMMMFLVIVGRANKKYKRFTSYEEMISYLERKKGSK